MTKEYIEREKAIEWFMAFVHMGESDIPAETVISDLKYAIPAADVAPVVHGRWVNTHSDSEFVQCSLCKSPVYAAWNVPSYCPNCGAYMMGENNGKCE